MNKYVACIDVDCLLIEDALLKLIKPFLETTDTKVIAAGSVIKLQIHVLLKEENNRR
jgi:hypothetical protein